MAQFRSISAVPKFSQRVTLNPSNVTAASVSVETFTVTGLTLEMLVVVNAPDLETGVKVVSARVSAANTLELTFQNFTLADVNPASQAFLVVGL